MKLENFSAAQNIVVRIVAIQEKIMKLEQPLIVRIATEKESYSNVETIGVFGNCEHEYCLLAKLFVDSIILELTNEKQSLLTKLETL